MLGAEEAKAGSHVWRQIRVKGGTVPGPRSGAASVIVGDMMYMFGGYGGNGRLDDFFEYSFETRQFRAVVPKGEVNPGVRENNGVVFYKGCLYIFGGYNGSQWLNDFHEFNLETESWRVVEPNGFCPASRFGYVSVVDADSFILFGGYDGTTWLNDMYEYNFVSKKWSQIEPKGTTPSIRSCPSWTKHDRSVFVLGGYDGVQRMNDFFGAWDDKTSLLQLAPYRCCLLGGMGCTTVPKCRRQLL